MDTEGFFQLLSAMHPLPVAFREAVADVLRPLAFPRGHYLVQAQTVAHHVYFLKSGFAVAFRYHHNKRVVTNFWNAGEIILSPKSFFQQLASDEIIQLAVDSELLSISHDAIGQICNSFPVGNLLGGCVLTDYYARCAERILDMHTLDAWQRYLKLIRDYSTIERFVSQDMIASFLNITPQSLSRLKHQHHKP